MSADLQTAMLRALSDSNAAGAAAIASISGGGGLESVQRANAPQLASISGALPGAVGGVTSYAGLTPAESWIVQRESGGRTNAKNPGSTAFGIWQGLEATRKRYLGADWQTTDYAKQVAAMRAYIRDRYGTAERAVSFHQQHGWY